MGAFLLAALSGMMLVRFSRMHIRFSADGIGGGPQKFHDEPIPRIGGVAIFAGLMLGLVLLQSYGYLEGRETVFLVVSILPVFLIGLAEDLTKRISPGARLAGSFVAAAFAFWLLGAELRRLDIPVVDFLLHLTPLALLVSLICMGGVAHAINIIDGYNGLAAGVGVIILSGLGFVGYQVHDGFIVGLCAVSVGALVGFLICNFPSGAIFAGDSGAYLIGFLIALASVLLTGRNPAVSAWFPMLLAIYPVWETLFSIYRKKFLRGHAPNMPDGLHLHMLVYKRLVRFGAGKVLPAHRVSRNSQTSPYLWLLTTLSAFPAILLWKHTALLMGFCAAFVFFYCRIYWSIVHFRSPKWLMRRIPLPATDAVENEV
jgi:UDP-N-acetylmuramyl pentapeptide phosphotransferase/UDP-N-acetylglucosamine-1-phosphate transferase